MSTLVVSPTSTTQSPRLTANEFVGRYGDVRAELIRGEVKELPMPFQKHGFICLEVALRMPVAVLFS